MKISGNQSAINEIVGLLDPNFNVWRMCHHCSNEADFFLMEKSYGEKLHMYEIEYDGNNILKCKSINGTHYAGDGSDNLLSGCVK